MASDTTSEVGRRLISAFFDTDGAAKKAVDDLIAAGIPKQHIARTGGDDAVAKTSTSGADRGFWEQLKDFFLPDEDRHTYAEGLTRGGYLLTVNTDEANYTRVLDILDTDGAVDMDEREGQWRAEGWNGAESRRTADSGVASGLAGVPLSAGVAAPAIPLNSAAAAVSTFNDTRPAPAETNWRGDEEARAAALDGSVNAVMKASRTGIRDTDLGRSRLRSYSLGDQASASQPGQSGSFSAATDAQRIIPHMEVISADGQTIGTVDHLDGPDRIKLAKTTSPDGEHHHVPFSWIDHVDQHVHLSKTLAEIKAGL